MEETHEYPESENRDSALSLSDIAKRLDALSAAVLRIEGWAKADRIKMDGIERAVASRADTQDLQLGDALSILREIHATVREAAPLLQSRAAKALKAGGTVLDYLKAGRG